MKRFLVLLGLVPVVVAADCDSNRTVGNHSLRTSGPVAPVPEPSAAVLFGAGLVAYGIIVRRRR